MTIRTVLKECRSEIAAILTFIYMYNESLAQGNNFCHMETGLLSKVIFERLEKPKLSSPDLQEE